MVLVTEANYQGLSASVYLTYFTWVIYSKFTEVHRSSQRPIDLLRTKNWLISTPQMLKDGFASFLAQTRLKSLANVAPFAPKRADS